MSFCCQETHEAEVEKWIFIAILTFTAAAKQRGAVSSAPLNPAALV